MVGCGGVPLAVALARRTRGIGPGQVRPLLGLLLLVVASTPVAAQTSIDVGGSFGAACLNSRKDCAGWSAGVFVGVSVPRAFVRVRYFDVRIGDRESPVGNGVREQRDREQRMLVGEAAYRFRPRGPVRPWLGASIGRRDYRETNECHPQSCEELALQPGVILSGRFSNPGFSVGVVAGIDAAVGGGIRVQGFIGVHNPFQDAGGVIDGALLMGIELWRSR
jgi:hypothetical protein